MATDHTASPPAFDGDVSIDGMFVGDDGIWKSIRTQVVRITSGGATIIYANAGTTRPVYAAGANAGTLTPNGNTILYIEFLGTPSGGGTFTFYHNVGAPPHYTGWRTVAGAEDKNIISTLTNANTLTLNSHIVAELYQYRFSW